MTKAHARFSIGIDLGTTNSALAFAPLVGEGTPEILSVPQWEGLAGLTEERNAAFLPLLTGGSGRQHTFAAGRLEPGSGSSADLRVSRQAKRLGGSSILRSPGFAIMPPTGRRRFCLGDRQIWHASRKISPVRRLCTDSELYAGDLEQPVCPGRVCVR